MNEKLLRDNLRTIEDFPIPGIHFKDVSTLFKNAECLREMTDEIVRLYKDKGITKVVGIESRGYMLAASVAIELGAGMVLCRKKGKLPGAKLTKEYKKEYGVDAIEIHEDALSPDDVVLIHDDLLATGGSALAAIELVKDFNVKAVYTNFIVELRCEGLKGREFIGDASPITALLTEY